MASKIGEYEGTRPEGLDPPPSVPLDGRGESPLGGYPLILKHLTEPEPFQVACP